MKRFFRSLAAAYRSALLARETRRMLHGLNDRMLQDLGLRRDEIDRVSREARQSFFRR
ncbi:MAG: DUF1127 domain-containing protein [Betaproteobacteria bacterium]